MADTPAHTIERLEGNARPPSGIASFFSVFRSLARQNSKDEIAHVTKADISTPFIRSAEEETQLVESVRQRALESGRQSVADAEHFWVLAAVRARKGDVTRAEKLLANFISWRKRIESVADKQVRLDKTQSQLKSCFMFVSGTTDKAGRPVLHLKMAKHDPSSFSALDTIRTLSTVLEWTLRTYPAAQTHGMVVLHDMSDIALHNLDLRMPGEIQKAFSQSFPVRVASIILCHPPFFLKHIVGFFSSFMSSKLKARITTVGKNDKNLLDELFEPHNILVDLGLGGTAIWTQERHLEWVRRIDNDAKAWPEHTLTY